MIFDCKFNKERDIEKVVPDLAISIDEAVTTGVVKSTSDNSPYSEETDVNNVGNYITEPTDIAMEAKRVGAMLANMPTTAEVKE